LRRLTGLIVLALVGLTLFTCLMLVIIAIPR
jgi:hypothetical protein